MTRVTIAMATCNGGAHVVQQLESIAAQTRPPDELVICDDASEDDTVDKLRAFAAKAPFSVRIECNPERLGITGNFGRALALSSGDVLFFADQDDIWASEKIATLCAGLEARPEVGAIFHDARVVDGARKPLPFSLWEALGFSPEERERVERGEALGVFLRHTVAAGTTLAFRAEFLADALPLPDLYSCHDAFVALVIAGRAPIGILREPLSEYRLHGANQIGIRRLGLLEQVQRAREQIERDAFGYDATLYAAARERLARHPDVDPAALEALEERIAHARFRCDLPERFLGRLPRVIGEARRGRYARYAYGWRSVAQDLLLR